MIDRTERIDKSLYRLGLDWVKYVLKHSLDFQPIFHFQPFEMETKPEDVMAEIRRLQEIELSKEWSK